MNRREEDLQHAADHDPLELEPELREALGNFKSSVNAWSEAMMHRPREIKAPARSSWAAPRWALGCAVFLATVSGGVYQNHRHQEAAKAETARIAEQQRLQSAQRAQEEADLLAKVDNDIARQVPSALEPLASLMDDNQNIGN